jgi:hypothetical protein
VLSALRAKEGYTMDKTRKALIERIFELVDKDMLAQFGYIEDELPDISAIALISLFEKVMFYFYHN